MTNDNFTEAARAEADRRMREADFVTSGDMVRAHGFTQGAEWARTHLAAQEPTEAEVDAGMASAAQSMPAAWWGGTEWRRYVEEILSAASASRRDEEKR